jgi:hypothetical protein
MDRHGGAYWNREESTDYAGVNDFFRQNPKLEILDIDLDDDRATGTVRLGHADSDLIMIYRLGGFIGEGSFGTIHRLNLDRDPTKTAPPRLAMKITRNFHEESYTRPRASMSRVQIEPFFECLDQIRYLVHREGGLTYVVMPFVSTDLESFIRSEVSQSSYEDRFDLGKAVFLVTLRQLLCLFKSGFAYYDIKTPNILIQTVPDSRQVEFLLGDIEYCPQLGSCSNTYSWRTTRTEVSHFVDQIYATMLVLLQILSAGSCHDYPVQRGHGQTIGGFMRLIGSWLPDDLPAPIRTRVKSCLRHLTVLIQRIDELENSPEIFGLEIDAFKGMLTDPIEEESEEDDEEDENKDIDWDWDVESNSYEEGEYYDGHDDESYDGHDGESDDGRDPFGREHRGW